MHPKKRVKSQGYTDFEILNKSEDKFLAGELEIQLQKQYGYKIDRVKYHQGKYKSMGHKGGAKSKELGHTKKLQQIGSKIASSLPRTEAQMQQAYKFQKIGAAIAWSLPRTQKQIDSFKEARKIGSVIGGKVAGAIRKEQIRVPIAAYRKSDNSFVGEYISVTDCARELNLRAPDIFTCLNPNKSQYSTKGYTFKKIKK
jgi:hypothetical protein